MQLNNAYVMIAAALSGQITSLIIKMMSVLTTIIPWLFGFRHYVIGVYSTNSREASKAIDCFLTKHNDWGTNGTIGTRAGLVFGLWYYGRVLNGDEGELYNIYARPHDIFPPEEEHKTETPSPSEYIEELDDPINKLNVYFRHGRTGRGVYRKNTITYNMLPMKGIQQRTVEAITDMYASNMSTMFVMIRGGTGVGKTEVSSLLANKLSCDLVIGFDPSEEGSLPSDIGFKQKSKPIIIRIDEWDSVLLKMLHMPRLSNDLVSYRGKSGVTGFIDNFHFLYSEACAIVIMTYNPVSGEHPLNMDKAYSRKGRFQLFIDFDTDTISSTPF